MLYCLLSLILAISSAVVILFLEVFFKLKKYTSKIEKLKRYGHFGEIMNTRQQNKVKIFHIYDFLKRLQTKQTTNTHNSQNKMKLTSFVLVFLAILNSLVYGQSRTWVLSSPANVVKVETEVGGTVSGNLNWQGEGAILSLCLLQGGVDLNSKDCLQRFSVPSGNTLLFSYIAPVKSTLFLRVDPDSLGSSDVKYTIEYSSSTPQSSASKTMGISLESPHDIITYLNGELSSGYHYTLESAQKNTGAVFEAKLKSPAGGVTFFTAINGEQKCFVNIDKEIGEWYIQIKNESPTAPVQDITEIALTTAQDSGCQQVYRLGQSYSDSSSSNTGTYAGAGAGGGTGLCLLILFCLCCRR